MRIFISYSRKNMDAANLIAAELTKLGANVFIDYERLQAGEYFPERLAFEVEKSDAVVFLLSEHSAASKWVKAEIQLAFHHDKPIIPVAVDSAEMPRAFFFLMPIERVDFTRWQSDSQIEAAIQKLVAALGLSDQSISQAQTGLEEESWKVQAIISPPFDWCPIPAGVITLEDASDKDGTTGGQFEVAAFAFARYPITNTQYQAFLDADDGYRAAHWWDYSHFAQDWREKHSRPTKTAYEGNDLPRTNVGWYDAIAFCRWLSDKTGLAITLPTEQQWQRAAQGDDNRTFPWGNDEPNDRRCNFNRNVGQPTPVTRYPAGASPYGVMDMSGNVAEWCLNEWGTESTTLDSNNRRAVRGGAWGHYVAGGLRAALPGRNFPNLVELNTGFRIALLI